MSYRIRLTPSAEEDFRFLKVHERRVIADAMALYLTGDPAVPSKRRKRLRPNPLAPWELRVGHYRVFCEIEDEATVKVVAVGYKEHNVLMIRGRSVDL